MCERQEGINFFRCRLARHQPQFVDHHPSPRNITVTPLSAFGRSTHIRHAIFIRHSDAPRFWRGDRLQLRLELLLVILARRSRRRGKSTFPTVSVRLYESSSISNQHVAGSTISTSRHHRYQAAATRSNLRARTPRWTCFV